MQNGQTAGPGDAGGIPSRATAALASSSSQSTALSSPDLGGRFQILSLCGGGYRGLYTAQVLALLENHFGFPIAKCFDLIAGTSVGGIIAIGLASGRSAGELRDAMQAAGPRVFGRNGPLQRAAGAVRSLFCSKHEASRLRDMVGEMLGDSASLEALQHPLVVPVVNFTTGCAEIFKTPHSVTAELQRRVMLVDVAIATAAAPVFFPPARVMASDYVDGGLIANAPDVIALHEAEVALGRPVRDVFMLSIGTTFPPSGSSVPKRLAGGLAFWLREHRLLELSLSSQQSLVHRLCSERLGERLLTVNWAQSHRQSRHLAMDVADGEATRTLLSLAQASFAQAVLEPQLHQLMAHRGRSLSELRQQMGLA